MFRLSQLKQNWEYNLLKFAIYVEAYCHLKIFIFSPKIILYIKDWSIENYVIHYAQ